MDSFYNTQRSIWFPYPPCLETHLPLQALMKTPSNPKCIQTFRWRQLGIQNYIYLPTFWYQSRIIPGVSVCVWWTMNVYICTETLSEPWTILTPFWKYIKLHGVIDNRITIIPCTDTDKIYMNSFLQVRYVYMKHNWLYWAHLRWYRKAHDSRSERKPANLTVPHSAINVTIALQLGSHCAHI